MLVRALRNIHYARRLVQNGDLTAVEKWLYSIKKMPHGAKSTKQLVSVSRKAWAIYPGHTECLVRAIAAAALFRSHGISAKVSIGVRTVLPRTFHAWVQTAENTLPFDSSDILQRFEIMYQLPGELSQAQTTEK